MIPGANLNMDEKFEMKKVPPKLYVETIKFYFSSIVHGVDGKRMQKLNEEFHLLENIPIF